VYTQDANILFLNQKIMQFYKITQIQLYRSFLYLDTIVDINIKYNIYTFMYSPFKK